ncbi:MAG TPA: hypothetical protein PLH23_03700 [Hyphomonadaceae bacterium]|jgi:hypothetical protein|nr:hypothetical protein [Hyphomonadaceae bacterium]HPI47346.1 hypothetical protein [Hyphomonadaceae bacterium]
MLGVEASSVITARVMKVAAGGESAQRELELMIVEKAQAGAQLQTKLAKLGPRASPTTALDTTLRHYRRKVTANRVRLSR